MQIIVGLGNPDDKYRLTRHNTGFMSVNQLVNEKTTNWQTNKKLKSEIIKFNDTFFVKPQTYMNNSGEVVQGVLSYYKLLPKKLGLIQKKDSDLSEVLTIIHDDIDIELGKYKTSINSRSAGHKGVESIINYLKTKNFKRIRIGIRTDSVNKIPADKFVLQKFSNEELDIINKVISNISKEL